MIPSPPTWVFSCDQRLKDAGKNPTSPGPAYMLHQSVGAQVDSRKPGAPTPGFGASTRDIRAKICARAPTPHAPPPRRASHAPHTPLAPRGRMCASRPRPLRSGARRPGARAGEGLARDAHAGPRRQLQDPRLGCAAMTRPQPTPRHPPRLPPGLARGDSSRLLGHRRAAWSRAHGRPPRASLPPRACSPLASSRPRALLTRASPSLVPPACGAVGTQVLSKMRQNPNSVFSRASRWASYEREMRKNTTPGPGAY